MAEAEYTDMNTEFKTVAKCQSLLQLLKPKKVPPNLIMLLEMIHRPFITREIDSLEI